MAKLIGDYSEGVASKEAIVALRIRHENHGKPDDKVAVYQNHALDSENAGHLVFIIVGSQRTLSAAPERAPDGPYGPGWKYLHVGFLNLGTNQMEQDD